MSTSASPLASVGAGGASRVSEYWAKQSEEARASRSVWINNEIVARHIYSLISGGSAVHWLPWFIQHYLGDRATFEKSLSICCGDGAHEIALYQTGKVHSVHGFDISEGAIARAISRFKDAAVPPEHYHFEVADANDLNLQDSFDLILSSGALHHITNLEGLLSNLAGVLTPQGYFVVVEYVGPNRFQWTGRQMTLINGILRQLDVRYLKDNKRVELSRPSLNDFIAIDPSEAVRSEEVLPLLKQYFTVEYLRNFNGAIAHQLYPLLNPELTNTGSADFDSILRLILFFEEVLVLEKVLPSDFVFAICRGKVFREGADDPTRRPPAADRFIGFIDVFDADGVCGWAADTLDPLKSVDVDIYINEDLVATVRCDMFRQDLNEAGYGDGRKCFHLRFPARNNLSRPAVAKLVIHGSGELLASRTRGGAG